MKKLYNYNIQNPQIRLNKAINVVLVYHVLYVVFVFLNWIITK